MFESPEPPLPGTVLEVGCYPPMDCDARTMRYMRIGAKVRWVSEILDAFEYEGGNRYKVGVIFDQIDPADQACVDGYVKKRLLLEGVQRIA